MQTFSNYYVLCSVNVSQFMSAKLVAKSVMRVGNCIVWSTASSPMGLCLCQSKGYEVTIPTLRFLLKPEIPL